MNAVAAVGEAQQLHQIALSLQANLLNDVDGLENPAEAMGNIIGWLVQHDYSDDEIRKTAQEIEKAGGKAIPLVADVGDEAQMKKAVDGPSCTIIRCSIAHGLMTQPSGARLPRSTASEPCG